MLVRDERSADRYLSQIFTTLYHIGSEILRNPTASVFAKNDRQACSE